MNELKVHANRVTLPVEPPSRILLVPWGEVVSKEGNFHVDADDAAAIVAAFKEHGVDIPIDREHATLGGKYASPDGSAPAMGWIKSLTVEEGVGIHADVEWTKQGAHYIREKEYRYLSPVVIVRKSDAHALRVHSTALTNTPAIEGSIPIVNKESFVMSDEQIERWRWNLNLPVTATVEEIMSEFEKLLSQLREAAGVDAKATAETTVAALKERLNATSPIKVAVCKALKLDEKSKDDDVIVAVNKAIETPAATKDAVPKSEHEQLLTAHREQGNRLTAVEEELKANKRTAFIERGEKTGQIVAANKGMWERSFDANPKQAEEDLKTAPQVGPAEGRLVNSSPRPSGVGNQDAIIANAERFDQSSMGEYERVTAYQKANKCSFEEALQAVGG